MQHCGTGLIVMLVWFQPAMQARHYKTLVLQDVLTSPNKGFYELVVSKSHFWCVFQVETNKMTQDNVADSEL